MLDRGTRTLIIAFTKRCLTLRRYPILRWWDSNPRILDSKSSALPLGHTNYLFSYRQSTLHFLECTRTRTLNPLIKSQVLYQLSYTPHLREVGIEPTPIGHEPIELPLLHSHPFSRMYKDSNLEPPA